jgi:hypothetical protein
MPSPPLFSLASNFAALVWGRGTGMKSADIG